MLWQALRSAVSGSYAKTCSQADATVGSASAVTYCVQHRLLSYASELTGLAADAFKIADMGDQVLLAVKHAQATLLYTAGP